MFKRWQFYALTFFIALASGTIAYYEKTRVLDLLLYDFAQRINTVNQKTDIVIIEIDDKSLNALGRWPWPRKTHARLLNILGQNEVKAVAYDVIFSDADVARPESDTKLSQALHQTYPIVLPVYIEKVGIKGQLIEVLPHKHFTAPSVSLGHVHVAQHYDGVVRSVFLKEGVSNAYWPHFSLALYNTLHSTPYKLSGEKQITETLEPQKNNDIFLIRRNYLNYIPLARKNDNIHLSFVDVIEGRVDKLVLKDKVVFVGATATGLGDLLTTSLGSVFGVEINAWIYNSLVNDSFIFPAPRIASALISFFLTLFCTCWLASLPPRWFLVTTISLVPIVAISSIALQNIALVWLPLSSFLLAVIVFYPLWNWQRLELVLAFLRTEQRILRENDEHPTTVLAVAEPSLTRLKTLARHLQKTQFLTSFTLTEDETVEGYKPEQRLKPVVDLDAHYLNISLNGAQLTGILSEGAVAKSDTRRQINILLNQFLAKTSSLKRKPKLNNELVSNIIFELKNIKKNDNANRRLVKQTLSTLKDGVIVSDMFGTVLFANQAFYNLSDTRKTEGHTLLELLECISIANEGTWPALISQLSFKQASLTLHATHAKLDRDYLFQANSENIYHDFPDMIILTFTDITQVKSAEKSKIEALNFLSHDLRAPLISVLSTIELNRTESNIEVMDQIEGLVRKNLHYADSFLSLSKAKGVSDNLFYPCDMHNIVDNAHAHALNLCKFNKNTISVERTDEDAWVVGDSDLLERAVINLVSNAVKYSEEGGQITLRLYKVTHLELETKYIAIDIEDNGEGICEEDQKHLFDRFARGKNQKKTGSGLGLHFVKTVANRHKGSIAVSSERGEGSTFTLSLPEHVTEQT